jgi:hypothetical protein
VAIKDLQNLMWNGAILSGGLSIVARVHARQAWKRFEAALADAHAQDAGDRLYQRDWDFRYWHGIGYGRRSSRSSAPSCGSFPGCSTYDPPRSVGRAGARPEFCTGLRPADLVRWFCRDFSMRTERGLFHSQPSRSQDVELLDER